MKKIFLLVAVLLVGLVLFIDNSFFRSASRRIASDVSFNGAGNPADDKDLSGLSAEEFARAFKYSLINPITTLKTADQIGVQLGNFYIKGKDDQKLFVCSKYNFIELTFQAEGIAVAGEIPRLVVRGPCTSSSDYNSIQALPIPYHQLMSAPVSQTQFRVPIADSTESALISIHFPADEWPTQWNLVGVKLYSDYSSEILSLNGYEIISILGKPFTLDWLH